MAEDPLVYALMLTEGRPRLARRAVRAFMQQSYENRLLLILYRNEADLEGVLDDLALPDEHKVQPVQYNGPRVSIGELRNIAIKSIDRNPLDIICHWDDDDWSHRWRIADQVDTLRMKGHEAVGFNSMLFYRVRMEEAWIYTNPRQTYCLGTSLCYWRWLWERHHFAPLPVLGAPGRVGEDFAWAASVKPFANSVFYNALRLDHLSSIPAPRMIATVHEDNAAHYHLAFMDRQMFKRAPEYDQYCRETLVL